MVVKAYVSYLEKNIPAKCRHLAIAINPVLTLCLPLSKKLGSMFFFTRLQILSLLEFNKFRLVFFFVFVFFFLRREVFQMVRASLDYSRSEMHSIS